MKDKRPSGKIFTARSASATIAVAACLPGPGVWANPTGGQVVSGSATITEPNSTTVDITQSSQRAIIDWQSFSIAPGQHTSITDPNASAVTLNRVQGGDPSLIAGQLTSNGQVILVNPSGITFSQGSQVDVGGLVATTANISNANFNAGNLAFDKASTHPGAGVVNQGTLTVGQAGLAALVAPSVVNAGTINAKLGKVVLGGAETFTVDLYGDGLVSLDASSAVKAVPVSPDGHQVEALVSNTGQISADGGHILLTADAAYGLVTNLVTSGGTIDARSIGTTQGRVDIAAQGGGAAVSGTIDVSGLQAGSSGGMATVTGASVTLAGSAVIDAAGSAGGGTVKLGGGKHGQDKTIADAGATSIASGARIDASATAHGNGGIVTVWSNGATNFAGSISAAGGSQGGSGGFVETSGATLRFSGGSVDTQAKLGHAGTWLLDPTDLTINSVAATTLETELAKTNIVVSATGAITVQSTITAPANAGSLGLVAGGNIDLIGKIDYSAAAKQTVALSAGGSIVNGGGAILLGAGDSLSLSALTGIGTSAAPIAVDGVGLGNTITLAAINGTGLGGSGGIFITDGTASGLSVGGVGQIKGTVSSLSSGTATSVAALSGLVEGATGGIAIDDALGQLSITGASISGTSTIDLSAKSLSIGVGETVSDQGNIALTADSMALGGLIEAGGTISLNPLTPTLGITLGGIEPASLVLSAADLNTLNAASLTIGSLTEPAGVTVAGGLGAGTGGAFQHVGNVQILAGIGGIAIDHAVALPDGGVLTLHTTGSIAAAGALGTAGAGLGLVLQTGQSVTLSSANNAIASLSGSVGGLTLVDKAALTIGSGTVGLTSTGPVSLSEIGAANPITLAEGITLAPGELLTLNTAGTVNGNGAAIGVGAAVGGVALSLQGGGNFALGNAANAVSTVAGTVGTLTLVDAVPLSVGTAGGVSGITATGTLSLSESNAAAASNAITIADAISSGSALQVQADTLALAATVSGPTVTLLPGTATEAVNIGGVPTAGLALSKALLNQITATTLIVGSTADSAALSVSGILGTGTGGALQHVRNLQLAAGSGGIAIGNPVALPAGGVLTLDSAGPIGGGAPIGTADAIATMLLEGGGAVSLTNHDNEIGTVAGTVGGLTLVDNAALTIGSVAGTNGLVSTGSVNLAAGTNSITIADAVTLAPGGMLTLDTAGTVNGSAVSLGISGPGAGLTLVLQGGGAFMLTNAGNSIATVAGAVSSLDLADAIPFTVGAVGSVHGITATGNVTLTGSSTTIADSAITVADAIASSAGAVRLQADALSLEAGVAAFSTVTLEPFSAALPVTLGGPAAGGFYLAGTDFTEITAPTLFIGSAAATSLMSVAGPISFAGTLNLASGSAGIAINDDVTSTVALGLNAGGAITQTAGIITTPMLNAASTAGGITLVDVAGTLGAPSSVSLATAAGKNASLVDSSPLSLTATIGGALTVTADSGITAISGTAGSASLTGSEIGFGAFNVGTILTADAADLTVNGAVSAGTSIGLIADTMNFAAGLTSPLLTLAAETGGRPITLGGTLDPGADLFLSSASIAEITAANVVIGQATDTGGITIAGPASLTGAVTLQAGTGSIGFNGNFTGGAVTLDAGGIIQQTAGLITASSLAVTTGNGAIDFTNVSAPTVSLTTAGAATITDIAPTSLTAAVGGLLTATANGQSLTLGGMAGSAILQGGLIRFNPFMVTDTLTADATGATGGITIAGNLSAGTSLGLTSSVGITQTGGVITTPVLEAMATGGAIVFTDVTSTGPLSQVSLGASGGASLVDADATDLASTVSGLLKVTSGGALGVTGTAGSATLTGPSVSLGDFAVGTTLSAQATGAGGLTLTGIVSAGTEATLISAGAIAETSGTLTAPDLSATANGGGISLTQVAAPGPSTVSLKTQGEADLTDLSATNLTASVGGLLNANIGGALSVIGTAQSATLSAPSIDFGKFNVTTTLMADASGPGGITIADSLTVGTSAALISAGGILQTGGVVNVPALSAEADGGDIALIALTAPGTSAVSLTSSGAAGMTDAVPVVLTAAVTGALQVNDTGTLSLTGTAGSGTLKAQSIDFGAFDVGTVLSATATGSGGITIADNLTVGTSATLVSAGGILQTGGVINGPSLSAEADGGNIGLIAVTAPVAGIPGFTTSTSTVSLTTSGSATLTDMADNTVLSVAVGGAIKVDAGSSTDGTLSIGGTAGSATLTANEIDFYPFTASGPVIASAYDYLFEEGAYRSLGTTTLTVTNLSAVPDEGGGVFNVAGSTITAAGLSINAPANGFIQMSDGSIVVTGGNPLTINAGSIQVGSITASGSTSFNAPGNNGEFDLLGTVSAKSITITADDIDLEGNLISSGSITVTAPSFINSYGQVAGGNILANGSLTAGGSAVFTAGSEFAQNLGSIIASTLVITTQARDLSIEGTIATTGDATLAAKGDLIIQNLPFSITDTASLTIGGKASLTAGGQIDQQAGAITAASLAATSVGGPISLAGTVATTGTLTLDSAADITISNNLTAGTATLTAAGAIDQSGGSLSVQSLGLTAKGGGITLDGFVASGGDATVSAAGDVVITQGFTVGGSALISASGQIDQQSGTITAAGLSAQSASGPITLAGTVTTTGALGLDAGSDILLSGTLNAGMATLTAAGAIDQTGGSLNAQSLSLTAKAGAITLAGDVASAGDATLKASGDIVLSQSFGVAGAAGLTAGGAIDQQSGTLTASALTASASGGPVTIAGTVTIGGSLSLNSASDIDIAGTTTAGSAASLAAGGAITQTAGVFTASSLTASAGGSISFVDLAVPGIALSTPADASLNVTVPAVLTASIGGALQVSDTGSLSISGMAGSAVIDAASIGFGDFAVGTGLTGNSSGAGGIAVDGAVLAGSAINLQAVGGGATIGADGSLRSTGGTITLAATGGVTDAGSVSAVTDLIDAGGAVIISGALTASQDIWVGYGDGPVGSVDLSGTAIAGGSLGFRANGGISVGGRAQAGSWLFLDAGGNIVDTGLVAGQGVVMTSAGSIDEEETGNLVAGVLAGSAGGYARLDGLGNQVGSLAGFSAGGAVAGPGTSLGFALNDTQSLTLTDRDQVATAVTSADGVPTLSFSSSSSGSVSAASGAVVIDVIGPHLTLTLADGADITARKSEVLLAANNVVQQGIGKTDAQLTLVDTTGNSFAGSGALRLPAYAAGINLGAYIAEISPLLSRGRQTGGSIGFTDFSTDGALLLVGNGAKMAGKLDVGALAVVASGGSANFTGFIHGYGGLTAASNEEFARQCSRDGVACLSISNDLKFNDCAIGSPSCVALPAVVIARPPEINESDFIPQSGDQDDIDIEPVNTGREDAY